MPNKPTIPTTARRLPAGTTRADYEPEVLAEYDRNRWRRNKRKQRSRKRHVGYRDTSFFLSRETRDGIAELAKAAGVTRATLIAQLVKEKLNG